MKPVIFLHVIILESVNATICVIKGLSIKGLLLFRSYSLSYDIALFNSYQILSKLKFLVFN